MTTQTERTVPLTAIEKDFKLGQILEQKGTHFFCRAHLAFVEIAYRAIGKLNYCTQCWHIIKSEPRQRAKEGDDA